jgi:antitoxin CcdA
VNPVPVMLPMPAAGAAKRPTNLTVRGELLDAARAAGVNLSELLERALIEELARLQRVRWRRENSEAVAAYNDHLQQNGRFVAGRPRF